MGTSVVLDAGPLVGLVDRRDFHHRWCVDALKLLPPPFLTCEAVIAETLFLLEEVPFGSDQVMGMLRDGLIRIAFDLDDNLEAVSALLAKYRDVPMSLADACLVRMTELHDRARVFTLDADFKLYRRHSRHTIPLIFPGP
jgi:predicted nucleic acid-binding protein